MNKEEILKEIMNNLEQVPLECQEKILDIVKAMAFTRKCLREDKNSLNSEKESNNKMDNIIKK